MASLEILQKELKTLHRKVRKCNEHRAQIRRLIYSKHLSPEAAALFKKGTIARQGAEEWAALKANEKTYTDWADEYGCAIAMVEEMIKELNGVPERFCRALDYETGFVARKLYGERELLVIEKWFVIASRPIIDGTKG